MSLRHKTKGLKSRQRLDTKTIGTHGLEKSFGKDNGSNTDMLDEKSDQRLRRRLVGWKIKRPTA